MQCLLVHSRHLLLLGGWLCILDYWWLNFMDRISCLVVVRAVRCSTSLGQPASQSPLCHFCSLWLQDFEWLCSMQNRAWEQDSGCCTSLELGHDACWGSQSAAFLIRLTYELGTDEPTSKSSKIQSCFRLTGETGILSFSCWELAVWLWLQNNLFVH